MRVARARETSTAGCRSTYDVEMPIDARAKAISIIGAYNLVQNRLLPPAWYVPANLLTSAALLALARRAGCTWRDLGLARGDVARGIEVGLAGAGLAAVGATAMATRSTWRERLLDERVAGQKSNDVLFHTLVRFPLGTALFEEIAFRGVVEGTWMNSGASEREAATVAAALFGLWHLIPTVDALRGNPVSEGMGPRLRAGAVLGGAAITSLASLGFSWSRRRSGSLFAPWLAHTAISCGGYLAGVFAWRRHGAGSSTSGRDNAS